MSQISATSGSSMSGFLPSFPCFNTSFVHQVAVSSTNVHAAGLQTAAARMASNHPRGRQASSFDNVSTTMDALVENDVGSTVMHAPSAEPLTEEDVGSGDVVVNRRSLQLAQDMSDLPHPPSPEHNYAAVPDSMLPSSAFTSMSVDHLPGLAASSQEVVAPAVDGVSSTVLSDRPTEIERQILSGGRCAIDEETVASPALDAIEHEEAHACGKQGQLSPHSTSRHTWVTAAERSMTSSTCGGTATEQEALTTPDTVSTSQRSRHTFSPVLAFSAMSAMSTPKEADAPLAVAAASPPTLMKPVEDDSNEDSSLLSAGLPGRMCAEGVGQTGSGAISDLSRMSAARSQFGLLQGQVTPGGDYPVSPSSRGSSASPPVSSTAADKNHQPRHDARRQSTGTDQQAGPNSQRGSDISISSTKNPLFRRDLQKSLKPRRASEGTAGEGKSAATARPGSRMLRRAGSSLKRALSRSFHTVKSLTVSSSTTDLSRSAPHSSGALVVDRRQPLLRCSFIPQSSLFRSIQESILSITDDEAEHENTHRAATYSLDSHRAEAGDVVAAVGHSPLQAYATPSGAHAVHHSEDMETPASGATCLHTPHSRTTSAQSGPQLLPPSPAALVGSQLSESVSSHGHSANDSSPAKLSASHGQHTIIQGAPCVVSAGHTQHVTELLGRPEDGEWSRTVVRNRQHPRSSSHVDESPVARERTYQSLQRRSALAACFCGMLDNHHHDERGQD